MNNNSIILKETKNLSGHRWMNSTEKSCNYLATKSSNYSRLFQLKNFLKTIYRNIMSRDIMSMYILKSQTWKLLDLYQKLVLHDCEIQCKVPSLTNYYA